MRNKKNEKKKINVEHFVVSNLGQAIVSRRKIHRTQLSIFSDFVCSIFAIISKQFFFFLAANPNEKLSKRRDEKKSRSSTLSSLSRLSLYFRYDFYTNQQQCFTNQQHVCTTVQGKISLAMFGCFVHFFLSFACFSCFFLIYFAFRLFFHLFYFCLFDICECVVVCMAERQDKIATTARGRD